MQPRLPLSKQSIVFAISTGMKQVKIIVTGFGQGRDSSIRTILNSDLLVDSLIDKTTIAHGGVRPPKARRT